MMELDGFNELLKIMAHRRWRWVNADKASGGFITSDHPVHLFSYKPSNGLMALGYGMSGTIIHFPISPFLAVQGEV
jgi:hypothetical protein